MGGWTSLSLYREIAGRTADARNMVEPKLQEDASR
jgi:hypothetical protein